MHLLLTDILGCPRCGPEFGLILLADRVEERRVITGGLGCANCRNRYPIRDGVLDLRVLPPSGLASFTPSADGGEHALRLAALSGLADREGTFLLAGAGPALVGEVASLLPNARVVGIAPAAPPGAERVEWLLAEGALPFRHRTLSAAAIVGPGYPPDVTELARVLLPGGRLVLDGTGVDAAASLPAAAWTILLEQDGVAVASRTPAG